MCRNNLFLLFICFPFESVQLKSESKTAKWSSLSVRSWNGYGIWNTKLSCSGNSSAKVPDGLLDKQTQVKQEKKKKLQMMTENALETGKVFKNYTAGSSSSFGVEVQVWKDLKRSAHIYHVCQLIPQLQQQTVLQHSSNLFSLKTSSRCQWKLTFLQWTTTTWRYDRVFGLLKKLFYEITFWGLL